ncbi:succinylglutamate-semialdehyde dehydrogenase [Planctomicrobium sp. SH661]|uniref:succinylglutamate-semialdehyde dehydrogenase n=1 Tax=Planctomicrobium sp. SH661 TaxID=3448124 RepID=UPI003F5BA72F
MLLINGIWREATGEELSSQNPADGQTLWQGREASADDVDAAVHAARDALTDWGRRSLDERAGFLNLFREQLEQEKENLARIISQEVGKALWDAATEVQGMIGKISTSLKALKERRSPQEVDVPGGRGFTRYKPHGALAVYGPFNFPGHIANGQIIPALAAGNTILFKPSELSPRVAEETVKLWERAGLPPGVLNLVQGGRTTGEALAKHPGVNGVLFTGSLQTGIALRKALVEQPEKILVLELGGNNPLVVHRVRDVDAAVYCTVQSAFITAGQRCTCARRLIVTDGNEQFLTRLQSVIENLRVAEPDADPQPFFGPLVSPQAADRVIWEQTRLLESGAKAIVESKRLPLGHAYVSPGLIDVTSCQVRSDHEVFGPLLQVMHVPDLQAAIVEANRTQFGLVAALLSDDREDFETFYDTVQAGLINWNKPTTGASAELPFGGVGRSGNHRPAGAFAVDFCNVPIASLESPSLTMPANLCPGVMMP